MGKQKYRIGESYLVEELDFGSKQLTVQARFGWHCL